MILIAYLTRQIVAASTIGLLLLGCVAALQAEAPHEHAYCLEQCRSALGSLESSLAAQPQVSATWRKYLRLDELARQIELGPAADDKLIAALCQRISADEPGLDLPAFSQLRTALNNWNACLGHHTADRYWEQAQTEADHFQGVSAEEVEQAWKTATAGMQLLDQNLNTQGAAGVTWRSWLQWDTVQKALHEHRPELITLHIEQLWTEALQLWGSPSLYTTAGQVKHWQQMHINHQHGESDQTYLRRLTTLQEAYQHWQAAPSDDRLAPVVLLIQQMEECGQATALTYAFRRQHSRPNLVVHASRRFIERETRRVVSDSFPIQDTIAGTEVHGTGKIEGQAYFLLIPTEREAALDVSLDAQVSSKTSSNTSGVQIDTHGTTQVNAKKRLTIGGLGMRAATTQTTATANIHLDNLDAGGKLRQRVAMQQFTESQPAAKKESEAKTALYVSTRLDDEVNQLQRQLTSGQGNRFIAPLVAYQPGFPRWWRTTNQGIEGRFWAAAPGDFAATNGAPSLAVHDGFAVQFHESFLERSLQKELGGRTIRSNELQHTLGGILPGGGLGGGASEEDESDWTMHFAAKPVGISFNDQIARMTFFCTGFTSEKGTFPGLQVTTAYRLVCAPPHLMLKREDIEVLPLDYSLDNPVQLSGRQQLLRRMVQRMFEKQMPPRFHLSPVRPTPESRLKSPLDFVRGEADNGWMSLVMEVPTTAAR